jgi:hypothetical protein
MNKKSIFLILPIVLFNCVSGADTSFTINISDTEEERSPAPTLRLSANDMEMGCSASRVSSLAVEGGRSESSAIIAHRTGMREKVVTEAHDILSNDYIENLKDLRKTRWFFRKVSSYTGCIANVLLHGGGGISIISSGIQVVQGEQISTISLAASVCYAAYGVFIGIAKCSAAEERERENHLKDLARKVGFSIVPLPHTVVDAADEGGTHA